MNRLYNDENVHADAAEEILTDLAEFEKEREKETAKIASIEEWILRYGGIITRLYPHLVNSCTPRLIGYNAIKGKMWLSYETKSATISFSSDGTTSWSDFDDGEYDSKSYGARSSLEFFEPIKNTVEERYYSDESFEEDAKRFAEMHKAANTSVLGNLMERLKSLLIWIVQIGITIAFAIWMMES